MITQQSVNNLELRNQKRLNVSLSAEVEELKKRVEVATADEMSIRQENQLLKGKLD